MKLCRFHASNAASDAKGGRLGLFETDFIRDVTPVLDALPALRWPLPPGDQLIANLDSLRPKIEAFAANAQRIPVADVKLLSPIANPNKIICGVANYPEHVAATKKQPNQHGLFFKALSSLVGPSYGVELRLPERLTVHETELAIVIGKQGTRIPRSRALEYVAGYTIGMDITMRGEEAFSFLKSFDTYAVAGPCLVTADEIPMPNELGIKLWLNGELKQDENTRRMVFDVPRLIEFAASILTLYPGDIILTGNPKGASPLKGGDVILAEIESIGRMEMQVRANPAGG